jgi:N-acetylglucosaminyl-diphospho-decaprenol L-rhamnosyltransferase
LTPRTAHSTTTRRSVGVAVVSYNSADALSASLPLLIAEDGLELVVVDNASQDKSVLVAEASGAEIVRLDQNMGFAYGCNRGADALRDRCDWLAFVNPDVEISGRELLRLASEAPGDLVALTPNLVDHDGVPQRAVARPEPTVGQLALRFLLSARCEYKARRMYTSFRRQKDRYFDTPVLSGACLLVRADAFYEVGGFCEAYFFNVEDIDLTCRLRWAGGRIAVDRSLEVVHERGHSSSVPEEARILEAVRAMFTFFALHRTRHETLAAGLAMVVGCVLRGLIRLVAGQSSYRVRSPAHAYLLLAGALIEAVRGQRPCPGKIPRPMFV